MKKSITLISFGILNAIHGISHIIQFVQSIILASYSTHAHIHEEGWLSEILHSPILAFVWAIIGIVTLIIGVRDYRHHKKCKH